MSGGQKTESFRDPESLGLRENAGHSAWQILGIHKCTRNKDEKKGSQTQSTKKIQKEPFSHI